MLWAQKQKGFTIVELLIVIVVIAILAAITIVAYNGISNNAKASAAQSAVSQAVRKVQAYAVANADAYPATLALAGVSDSGDTTYQYYVNNSANPPEYCITATYDNISYFQNNTSNQSPSVGACPGHGVNGLPPNLAINPSFETAAAAVTVRTNLFTNPSIETATTGWTTVNAGTGASINQSTGLAQSGSSSLLYTLGDSAISDSGPAASISATAGVTYTVSAWVNAPAAISSGLRLISYGSALGNTLRGSTSTTTNAWVQLTNTVTATATGTLSFAVGKAGSTTDTGKLLYVDNVTVEATSAGDAFNGSTAAQGDFTYGWTGTAQASTSYQRANNVANYTINGSNNIRFQSGARATHGSSSAQVLLMNGAVNPGLYQSMVLQPGTYTFISKIWAESGVAPSVSLTAQGTGVTVGSMSEYPGSTSVQGQWVELRRVVTLTSANNVNFFTYAPGTINGSAGKSFWVDEFAVVSGTCTTSVCY